MECQCTSEYQLVLIRSWVYMIIVCIHILSLPALYSLQRSSIMLTILVFTCPSVTFFFDGADDHLRSCYAASRPQDGPYQVQDMSGQTISTRTRRFKMKTLDPGYEAGEYCG